MNNFSLTTAAPDSPALDALVTEVRSLYGEAVNAVLLYGSCLRSGDLYDGLVDLYLIVDNYSDIYDRPSRTLANHLMPPNVFYIEVPVGDKTVRSKYAILSTAAFNQGVQHWFQSYIWGRFTQPTAIAWHRDEESRLRIEENFQLATTTFLENALPALPASGSVRELWRDALQLSYHTELRAEKVGRTSELTDNAIDHYVALTRAVTARLPFTLQVTGNGADATYQADIDASKRQRARFAWPLRQVQGKILSMIRLLKALSTFEGGLDYLAWKLERHSGQEVIIPDRVRRLPLIFIWGLMWRLYRRGVFR
jgi:hypothetical protein